jgi:putative glycosyltransferase (TIGR04372 family)
MTPPSLLNWFRLGTAAKLRRQGVCVVKVAHPERIGHLALDVDSFVKAGKLGLHRHRFPLLLCRDDEAANPVLLDYWREHVHVVASPALRRALAPLEPLLDFHTHRYSVAINQTAEYHALQVQWAGRPPLLALTAADRAYGARMRQALGMPEDAWFVCIHSREGGFSPGDEHLHSYRNSAVESYLPAAREIVARGGWCIRMGDPTMVPLPPTPGVIDYALSPLRSARLDVVLAASCRFFLGSSSGLVFVSCAFGVPAAQTNVLPLSAVFPFGPRDVGIPKLLRARSDGRRLGFAEIMRSPVANYRFASLYAEQNIEVEDNSPDEIRDVAIEMLDRTGPSPRAPSSDDERRQQRFRALFRPGHYAYGSASRVGSAFLARHERLLED